MDKEGISVIIPVYNEEDLIVKNTTKILNHLGKLKPNYEVMLSCNGCTDKSALLANELASKNSNVKVILSRRRGVGLAFRKAVGKACFDKIVSLDMDLTIDMSFIQKACNLLADFEVVIGSKVMGTQRRSKIRRWGSIIYIGIAHLLMGLPFHDYSPSAKAYRRKTLLQYLDFLSRDVGTSYVVETIYRIFKSGGKITEISVDCDDTRKSKFNIIDEAIYRYRHLFTLFLKSRFWVH
ncbi:MAG: glycosyltransferase family 2 protein [Candidatus Omnitrophica bacterium]|nr:glycosyltransferase family 2 protein [Candidatus Omnitrophota bacterium]